MNVGSATAVARIPETKSIGDPKGANFPMSGEGRTYHVGTKAGEVANRILLVGDPERAKLIRQSLDNPNCFEYVSKRGFITYTGTKNGVPVSVVSIGMGPAMMDFAVREIRAVTKGDLALIRLGSCGTPNAEIDISTVVVANRSFAIQTDYDAYEDETSSAPRFKITKPIVPDASLHHHLLEALKGSSKGNFPVVEAPDATADTFYGSQGRIDKEFLDQNEDLLERVREGCPEIGSLQMETFHLFHLARLANRANHEQVMRVAGCAIVLAKRTTEDLFLSIDRTHQIEVIAGEACLEVLVNQKLRY